MSHFCDFCHSPNALKYCGNCKFVFYCNRSCQVNDWKEHGKYCHLWKQQKKKTIIVKEIYTEGELFGDGPSIENMYIPYSTYKPFWSSMAKDTYYYDQNSNEIAKSCYVDGKEENGRLVLTGNLLRCLSKGYFNHFFLLFCGVIRKAIASSNWMSERRRLRLKEKITNRRMHGASNFGQIFKYNKDYNERDIYDFVPAKYRPHYVNRDIFHKIVTIALWFYMPALSKRKSVKYRKLFNHTSVIVAIEQEMILNTPHFNQGFALIQNTMRKYDFDWEEYQLANNIKARFIPRPKECAGVRDSIILIILFSYLMYFDCMVLSLINGKYLYIEPNMIQVFDDEKELMKKCSNLLLLKSDTLWQCEIEHKMSNFYFKWNNIKRKAIKKYKIRKYWLDPRIFYSKCIVKKGKIYSRKGKDMLQLQERLIHSLFPPKE